MTAGSGYTAVQTARLVSAVRWALGRLFEITGAWATDTAEADAAAAGGAAAGAEADAAAETAVWLATLSRLLGAHREAFDQLQPDSVLLAEHRRAAPASLDIESALTELADAASDWPQRLAAAQRALIPETERACAEIERTGAAHCDAALMRAARAARADLECHRAGCPSPGVSVDGLTARAESLIAAVGGIVPAALLRPAETEGAGP